MFPSPTSAGQVRCIKQGVARHSNPDIWIWIWILACVRMQDKAGALLHLCILRAHRLCSFAYAYIRIRIRIRIGICCCIALTLHLCWYGKPALVCWSSGTSSRHLDVCWHALSTFFLCLPVLCLRWLGCEPLLSNTPTALSPF